MNAPFHTPLPAEVNDLLAHSAMTAIMRLAYAFQPGMVDRLAEGLRGRAAGTRDLVSALSLLEQVGRALAPEQEPEPVAPAHKPSLPSYKELARLGSRPSSVPYASSLVSLFMDTEGRGLSHKEAIATLVARGINYGTARKRVFAWFKQQAAS